MRRESWRLSPSRRRSPRKVVIESVIEGELYRLLTVGGRFFAASRRLPAQVTGDGQATVRELVERANQQPARRVGRVGLRSPIQLDKEALACLTDQVLTPDSRPAAGESVTVCPYPESRPRRRRDRRHRRHPRVDPGGRRARRDACSGSTSAVSTSSRPTRPAHTGKPAARSARSTRVRGSTFTGRYLRASPVMPPVPLPGCCSRSARPPGSRRSSSCASRRMPRSTGKSSPPRRKPAAGSASRPRTASAPRRATT